MSTHPRLEARMRAQERLYMDLAAHMEELADDVAESFKQQAAYQVNLERKIDARFDEMAANMNALEQKFDTRIDTLEANMKSMEARILDTFQQLVTMVAELRPDGHPPKK